MDHAFNMGKVPMPAGINCAKPKANDRRKAIRHMFGNWFSEHNLKLGRDYFVDFGWSWADRPTPQVCIKLKDARTAVLFKLRWVNVNG